MKDTIVVIKRSTYLLQSRCREDRSFLGVISNANPFETRLGERVSLVADGVLQWESDSHNEASYSLRIREGKYGLAVVGGERL
jgi:hypothetical protein